MSKKETTSRPQIDQDERRERRPYSSPKLKNEGHMADVTQKSGGNTDMSPQHPSKQ